MVDEPACKQVVKFAPDIIPRFVSFLTILDTAREPFMDLLVRPDELATRFLLRTFLEGEMGQRVIDAIIQDLPYPMPVLLLMRRFQLIDVIHDLICCSSITSMPVFKSDRHDIAIIILLCAAGVPLGRDNRMCSLSRVPLAPG